MENKINIAEILKDCPKGMELDCTMYGNLYFDSLNADYYGTINCYTLIDGVKTSINFTKYGTFNNHLGAKCVIFPKGKTTWDGFQKPFKDGDIIISEEGDIHLLRTKDSSYCAYRKRWKGLPKFDKTITMGVKVDRLATEEEKQKFFDTIKANGYHWNTETKTLEELVEPKFKVDDKIKLKGGDEFGIITEVADCFYTIKCKNNTHCWPIKKQDDWELINESKFKVGDRIKYIYFDRKVAKVIKIHDNRYELDNGKFIEFQEENAYEISYDKFDITTLKPFDKVLVRDNINEKWNIHFFSYIDDAKMFKTIMGTYIQCIPYEGNEHLLGTTNDCDEYYKNWE